MKVHSSKTTSAPGLLIIILAFSITLISGCGVNSTQNGAGRRSEMIFATTTSVQDSGILDEFIERFESEYPYTVKAVAVGSGAALFMGQNGDACVLVTHEPKAEKQFMEDGYGESIDKVMHNDFVIIGPPEDPAGIKDLKDPVKAAKKIFESGSTFVSRGDASGTHAMELSLWERAGIQPGGDLYIEAGQGMGPTIRIAEEKNAYTLTDRATFIVLENALDLEIMIEGDPSLRNQYSVIVINHEKHPDINYEGALTFREFLLSKEIKALIKDFGWDEYQKHLFYPD